MAGIKAEPTENGETKKAAEETSKASAAEKPKSRNGENAERSSPSSTTRKTPSPPMPLPKANMNHSRTPSTSPSVHSNNSGGTRTTATSRRGRGTRSRSPPAMSNRGSMSSQGAAFPQMDANGDSNPSSAAAAAAAAAKAFGHPHRGGGGGGGADGEPTKFPSGSYDNQYQGSRSWPAEGEDRPRRSGSYGHSQSIHRLPGGSNGGSGDLYGRHGPAGSYGSDRPYRGGRSGSMHPSYDEDRYGDRNGRGRSMSPSSDRYGQPYYRGGSGGMAPADGRSSPKGVPPPHNGGSAGGMSRVMGTATPIHVPRASESAASRHSRSGTPASVFRGRPSNGDGGAPSRDEERAEEEDTPQKILLSLRTPTTSFDEKQLAKNGKTSTDLPPSPDEPPQIQHTHNQQDFFEPSRSPKPDGSIEMAPSFNLFNQSFDSFGDTFNVVGNLDATLQSASFGAGPTASGDFGTGNLQQQLLGSSGSGALTFGMSPVNSFGNGPSAGPVSRRGNNVVVLGGQDGRSASPTQVLGMYQSYSGGGSHGMLRPNNSMGPLEDSHLRLSATSFGGAPSLSHNYTRSFGAESSPIMPYSGRMAHDGEGGQLFYLVLRRHRAAFSQCTFLLPGLKAALLEAPSGNKSGDIGDNPMMKPSMSHGGMYPEPSPQETAIAQRRVISAICSFGGTQSAESRQMSASGQSIFREKGETPAVTPSSSTGASSAKAKYNEVLPTRYYENENRLSWEFEDNPPVETPSAEDREQIKLESLAKPEHASSSDDSPGTENGDKDEKKVKDEDASIPPTPSTPSKGGDDDDASKNAESPSSGADTPKMRYRCKLCGQPKQNHTCPFMQSLARSIGVMVYPSVNAFTAAEPGVLAPPLTEMNNFMGPDDGSICDDSKASIPTPDRRHLTGPNGSTQVTPESRRSNKSSHITSPTSTLSAGSSTPQRPRTPGSAARSRAGSSPGMNPRTPGSGSRRSRKRRHGQMQPDGDQGDLLFVEPMEIKQEQFRMVTPSKSTTSAGAYTYAALPLPYAQRKRLSDNLFSLSQKIPQLTKECSAVLREAREKDMWDLAVAELMTQVVVVSHCHEGDTRFDGLRQYLLTLGIAC